MFKLVNPRQNARPYSIHDSGCSGRIETVNDSLSAATQRGSQGWGPDGTGAFDEFSKTEYKR
jgi:hypothetical protein